MRRVLGAVVAAVLLALPATAGAAPAGLPDVGHVWVVVLENKSYAESFADGTEAPVLRDLADRGALLEQYYGIAHTSLPNYLALVSGQGPNPDTQANCHTYTRFVASGPVQADGQLPGRGCVFPPSVPELGTQLSRAGISWKAYLQHLGASTTRQVPPCGIPRLGPDGRDLSRDASRDDQYAARHNPFAYFRSITDSPRTCREHLSPLTPLAKDLERVETTPAFNLVVPHLCDGGHDTPCAGPDAAGDTAGGLTAVQHWLEKWAPLITSSPAFRKDGLLIVTWDEAAVDPGPDGTPDADACCDERALNSRTPGGSPNHTALTGPGGGRTGALVLSPFIRPGTVSRLPYNHYSTLRTIEDLFDLGHLGYAGQATGVHTFGGDVFTSPRGGTVPTLTPRSTASAAPAETDDDSTQGWLVAGLAGLAAGALLVVLVLRLRRRSEED